MIREHARGAAAACVLLGLALSQSAAAETVRLAPGFEVDKTLLEAARKEGKVAFWCGWREDECKEANSRFTQLTGVEVNYTRLSTGPQVTRLVQEKNAGVKSVDVIHHAEPGIWETMYKAKKWLAAYTPASVARYAPNHKDKDGFFYTQFMFGSPIGYNTKLMSEAEAPKSYADLLDPKYKGKVAMAHPKHSGGFTETVIALSKIVGPDYFEKLKANDPLVVGGSQFGLNPVVANGERAIALAPLESAFITDAQAGKPLGVIYPKEGMVVISAFSAVLADAPQPNAARLLQDWLHSPALQTMLAANAYLVPHPDAEYPAGRKKLSEIKTYALTPAEVAAEATNAKEMFADLYGG